MYSVFYEPQAEDDLVEIVSYYSEQGGFALGEMMLERITQHIDRLEFFPYRTLESLIVTGTREVFLEKTPFKAFVFIDEISKKVHVLRVLHTARKFP